MRCFFFPVKIEFYHHSFIPVVSGGSEYKTLLHGPRFHFSGSFICDPATLNNNISNFDVTSFMPHHALRESEGGKGLYSPAGTNSFFLKETSISSVCYANQSCTTDKERDSIIGAEVRGK